MKSNILPPIETDFPIPTPPLNTTDPLLAAVVLFVELNVAVPVLAPIDKVVAAPNAFIVVAFVLKTANVESPVVTPVPKDGDELKTKDPEPVSSVKAEAIAEDVVEADTVPEETVRTPDEPVRFKPVPP